MRAIPCVAVLLAAAGLSLGACRRPTNSLEYVEASGMHDQLVVDQGDDAYLSPEMTQAEELLAKVPEDSLDAQDARELLAKIRSERARVKKEREEAAKNIAPAPTRDDWGREEAPVQEAAMGEEADGGPTQPTPGMALAEFRQRFGGCFDPGQDIVLAGSGIRQTYQLRDRDECRKRHAGFDGLLVVIDSERVGGFAQKSALRLTLPDGGVPPPGAEARQQAPRQAPSQQATRPASPPQGTVAQTPSDQVTTPPPTPPDQSGRDYDSIKY